MLRRGYEQASRTTLAMGASILLCAAAAITVLPAVGADPSANGLNPTQQENQLAGSASFEERTGASNGMAAVKQVVNSDSESGANPVDRESADAQAAVAVEPSGFTTQSSPNLRGYASQESVNRGESVNLHISSAFQRYVVSVYRTGWYGGTSARLVFETVATNGALRSVPAPDAFGKVDVGWPASLTLDTSAYVSGAYIIALAPEGSTTAVGLIPLIVREDSRAADILLELPTQTWQAYDNFGGKSTYDVNSTNRQRAYKVSLNRPYQDGGGLGQFNGSLNLIRFLERQGYDVAYAASSDLDRDANLMGNKKVLMSSYHDEYWTGQMFTNLQTWLSQGKHFVQLASNSIYWQTRYENNRRTLVVYKDAALDPYPDPRLKTTLFRKLDRPESEIYSNMFEGSFNYGDSRDWVVKNAGHWLYAGTGLIEGSRIKGLVGYEWDRVFDKFIGSTLNPRLDLRGTTVVSDSPIYNNLTDFDAANRHQATVKEYPSGAIVFNAATNYWPLLLTNNKPYLLTPDPTTVTMIETMTNNVLRRMLGRVPVPPAPTTVPVPTVPVPPIGFRGAIVSSGFMRVQNDSVPMRPRARREIQVAGVGAVPQNAKAAVVSLTAVLPTAPGHVTAYPCGEVPNASHLNFLANELVNNIAIVPLSSSGSLCVESVAPTGLLVDVTGYIPASSSWVMSGPVRLADTRPYPTFDGLSSGSGRVQAGGVLQVQVAGRGGAPRAITAAMINLTAVDASGHGHMAVYPCERATPDSSNLNVTPSAAVANSVLVSVGATGTVCVYTSVETNLVVDLVASAPSGAGIAASQPSRLVDTRIGYTTIDGKFAQIGVLRAREELAIDVGRRGAVGDETGLLALNLTVVAPANDGWITVGPCGGVPTTLSYMRGRTTARFVLVRPDASGRVCVFPSVPTHLVVDRLATIPE